MSDIYVSFAGLMPKDVDPRFVHLLAVFFGCVCWGGGGGGGQKFALEKAWSWRHFSWVAWTEESASSICEWSPAHPVILPAPDWRYWSFLHSHLSTSFNSANKAGEGNNYTFLFSDFFSHLRNKPIFDHKVSLIVFLPSGVYNLRSLAITTGYHSLTYVQRSFD